MPQTVQTKVLARIICRDPRTVQRLAAQGILPRAYHEDGRIKRGTFELIPCIQAFIKYQDDRLSISALNDSDFRTERTGLVRTQRQRAELELKLFKGELHRADDVEAVMNDVLSGIKMRMLGIPTRVARLLLGQSSISKVFSRKVGEHH
jgi:phage terminase Nu1 subunit (DNA packaging protein)